MNFVHGQTNICSRSTLMIQNRGCKIFSFHRRAKQCLPFRSYNETVRMQGHFTQTTKNYYNNYCVSKNVRKAWLTWTSLKCFRGFAKLARKKSRACFLEVRNQVKIPVASNLFWSWSFHFLNLLFCDNILVTFCISPFQRNT